ncbi:hypothetical protein GCM10027048_23580 [Hymenobacter coalescens]
MLLSLLLTAPGIGAQPMPRPLGTAPTQEDTVRAVRRLFNARSHHGAWLLSGSGVVAAGVGIANIWPAYYGPRITRGQASGLGLLFSGSTVGLGLWRSIRFSTKRRDEVVAAYQQGEPLPRFVRRRLQTKHFGL